MSAADTDRFDHLESSLVALQELLEQLRECCARADQIARQHGHHRVSALLATTGDDCRTALGHLDDAVEELDMLRLLGSGDDD
jgi:hypothetical protein